jgi:hypothetical protein
VAEEGSLTNSADNWGNGEQALPGDPPGELEVVDGHPDGGNIPDLEGISAAFTPDYQPEEIREIAANCARRPRAEPSGYGASSGGCDALAKSGNGAAVLHIKSLV